MVCVCAKLWAAHRAIIDQHIQTDTFQCLQRTAKQHGLWLTIEVNVVQGSLLQQLHTCIKDYFSSEGLTLPLEDPKTRQRMSRTLQHCSGS